jgi:hypothetical protein
MWHIFPIWPISVHSLWVTVRHIFRPIKSISKPMYTLYTCALLCSFTFSLVGFPSLLLAVCRAVLLVLASCTNEQCFPIISLLFPTCCTANFHLIQFVSQVLDLVSKIHATVIGISKVAVHLVQLPRVIDRQGLRRCCTTPDFRERWLRVWISGINLCD